jgi:hypothetical protein
LQRFEHLVSLRQGRYFVLGTKHSVHYVICRNQQLRVPKRFIVVSNIRSSFFGGLLKTQRARPNRYSISVLKLVLELRIAVYEHLVSAAAQLSVNDSAIHDDK